MSLREFRRGEEEWVVWDTHPTAAERLTSRVGVMPGFLEGWLTFTSGNQKRRLPSVPEGWEQLPDEQLIRLLDSATPAPQRPTRPPLP